MLQFALDYFVAVFASGVGVIQLAASTARLDGLLLFKSPIFARGFGLGLPLAAAAWFFTSEPRNINDFEGGLDANEQAITLFLGVLASVVVSLVASSLVNRGMSRAEVRPEDGFDALRHTSYIRALSGNLRYWRRVWPKRMKSYFFG